MTTPGPGHPTGIWFSYQRHVATSGQTNFVFSSINGYVSSEDLTVWVNGTQLATSAYTLNLAQTRIEFPAPGRTAGDIVIIRRITGPLMADRQVVFSDSTILVSADLNESALQLLHLSQEAIDTAFNALSLDSTLSNFTARSLRVTNMLPAVDGTDAVNKNQLDQFVLGQVQNNTIPLNKLVQVGADTVLGNNTGSTGNITSFTCTPLARNLIDDPTVSAMHTTLEILGKLFNLNPQIYTSMTRILKGSSPETLRLEFDVAQTDLQRLVVIDTYKRIPWDEQVHTGGAQPANTWWYGQLFTGVDSAQDLNGVAVPALGHYIALTNSSPTPIQILLLKAEFNWGAYVSGASSGVPSPSNVDFPWTWRTGGNNWKFGRVLNTATTPPTYVTARGHELRDGGFHTIAPNTYANLAPGTNKFYFPGTDGAFGGGWHDPAPGMDTDAIGYIAASGHPGAGWNSGEGPQTYAACRIWFIRLN